MTELELQQYLLREYPQENARCEWKEFKNLKNSFCGDEKDDVISYVSAIANMEGGHLVIGVKGKTLEIAGTDISMLTFNGQPANPQSATFKLTEQCTYLSSFLSINLAALCWLTRKLGRELKILSWNLQQNG